MKFVRKIAYKETIVVSLFIIILAIHPSSSMLGEELGKGNVGIVMLMSGAFLGVLLLLFFFSSCTSCKGSCGARAAEAVWPSAELTLASKRYGREHTTAGTAVPILWHRSLELTVLRFLLRPMFLESCTAGFSLL